MTIVEILRRAAEIATIGWPGVSLNEAIYRSADKASSNAAMRKIVDAIGSVIRYSERARSVYVHGFINPIGVIARKRYGSPFPKRVYNDAPGRTREEIVALLQLAETYTKKTYLTSGSQVRNRRWRVRRLNEGLA